MTTSGKFSFANATNDRLPKLALKSRGATEAVLRSGPWVETDATSFVAGAWGGNFARRDFERSTVQCGTAGKATEQGWIFSPPSHTLEWLYIVEEADGVWLSNSLAFLMSELDDGADIRYDGYFFDLLRFYRRGLTENRKYLRTSKGRAVQLWTYDSLLVQSDLSLIQIRRPAPNTPTNFTSYRKLLSTEAKKVTENACHAARRFRTKLE